MKERPRLAVICQRMSDKHWIAFVGQYDPYIINRKTIKRVLLYLNSENIKKQYFNVVYVPCYHMQCK